MGDSALGARNPHTHCRPWQERASVGVQLTVRQGCEASDGGGAGVEADSCRPRAFADAAGRPCCSQYSPLHLQQKSVANII